jgi:hypothetical protein
MTAPVVQPTSIRLPKDLKAYLVAEARRQNRPLSYQIIYILNAYRKHMTGLK